MDLVDEALPLDLISSKYLLYFIYIVSLSLCWRQMTSERIHLSCFCQFSSGPSSHRSMSLFFLLNLLFFCH